MDCFRAAALGVGLDLLDLLVQLLYQACDTESRRRAGSASIKIQTKGGCRYTYTASFSHARSIIGRNSILSGVSIYPPPHLFIPQTRTPGLGRREWPARPYISRGHIQSMTGSQSMASKCGFRIEGLVPVNSQPHHCKSLLRRKLVRTPRVAKVATPGEARIEVPKFGR